MPQENIDRIQQAHYEKVWSELKLSNKAGTSGWRTLVPAPDFIDFVAYLISNGISGKVLDLGCGGGRHAILLADKGFEVYGIDFSESAISLANANAERAGQHIDFRRGDALELPYPASFFDIANDDGCLHHIDPGQWQLYLQNLVRVIKPGGTLRIKAFSMNCAYYQQNSENSDSQWVHLRDSGYTYFFAESDIKSLFSEHFEIVSLEEKAHTQTTDKKFFFVILKRQA